MSTFLCHCHTAVGFFELASLCWKLLPLIYLVHLAHTVSANKEYVINAVLCKHVCCGCCIGFQTFKYNSHLHNSPISWRGLPWCFTEVDIVGICKCRFFKKCFSLPRSWVANWITCTGFGMIYERVVDFAYEAMWSSSTLYALKTPAVEQFMCVWRFWEHLLQPALICRQQHIEVYSVSRGYFMRTGL